MYRGVYRADYLRCTVLFALLALAASPGRAEEAKPVDRSKTPVESGTQRINEGAAERRAGQRYFNPCAKPDLIVSRVTIRQGDDGGVWITPCIAEVCNKATTVNGEVSVTPIGSTELGISLVVLPLAAGGNFCYGSAYGVPDAASYRVAVGLPAGREGNTANNACTVVKPSRGTSRTVNCPH